jgi:4'-phosphopantetheinyl transferase EntD
MGTIEARLRLRLGPAGAVATEVVPAGHPPRQGETQAGQACTRRVLAALGRPPAVVGRTPDRRPIWPDGVTGSLTHAAGFACAVAGRTSHFRAIGVDIEQVERVDAAVADYVCREDERRHHAGLPDPASSLWPAIAFSAKEALYKALPGAAEARLDFADLSLRLSITGPGSGGFAVQAIEVARPWAADALRMDGYWWFEDGLVATLALQNAVNGCEIVNATDELGGDGHAPSPRKS